VKDSFSPLLSASPAISAAVELVCSEFNSLETIESLAYSDKLKDLPLFNTADWKDFCTKVRETFAANDYLIIKGFPVNNSGATLLIAALSIAANFRTYRNGQIIKHFRMSPWTKELSHTTREGEFHTDLNTEKRPPAVTAMQCFDPDPGAPKYGVNSVARLADLLLFIKENEDTELLEFLTKRTVTMLNDHSDSSWSGKIVEDDMIRYHPETLRAAVRRFSPNSDFEEKIMQVTKVAKAVSVPFILDRGDVLLLSNYRTLHYRGECSVVFSDFPLTFNSRSIFILHANDELSTV
jgi:hypothetical protein